MAESFMAMAPDPPSIIHIYLMIVTLIILAINWLVLWVNEVSWLPWHCCYLFYLVIRLGLSRQPPSYVFSMQKAEDLRQDNSVAMCQICGKAKPPRYYHCRHCSKCIYRLDHHCDFVGNCVGQYNYKVYVHLLVNGFLHASIVTSIMLWNWREMFSLQSRKGLFWLLLLPGMFGIYETARLIYAFKVTVQRNQTLVESYKLVRGPRRPVICCFQEYFGNNSLQWWLPTFIEPNSCDLLEPYYPLERSLQIKEYTFADEYLYGGDDEDNVFDVKRS